MNRFVITVFFGLVSATTVAQTDYTQFVDPFVGTQGTGHTFPGACVPFGMIQTSPVTGAAESSEWYRLYGFGGYLGDASDCP